MFFSKALVLAFAVSALALPTAAGPQKRAAVLTTRSYADFQISDGVAGNALDEVHAKFPIDYNDLANVDPADLAIIKAARKTAENAETQAGGFNEAIDAAGGKNTEAGTALQIGKIKNKVLKLELQIVGLQIDQLINGKDNAEKIAVEQKKLANNINQDTAAAGQTSQSVPFVDEEAE